MVAPITRKESPMELLMTVLAAIASLLAVDIAAVTFGADSRDSVGDDWAR